MHKTNLLNLKNRKKIYDFISDYPGIHLRKIFEELEISESTIRYHLNYLVKHELITKQEKNGYARFYISDSNVVLDKKLVSYIRNENTRAIIIFFCFNVAGSLKTICKFLDKDKKEISSYLKKLRKDNIIEIAPCKNFEFRTGFNRCKKIKYSLSPGEKVYRLKDPYKLNNVLISFKNRFLDNGSMDLIIDFLLSIYKESNTRPKTIRDTNNGFQEFFELFFEIFPNPYHV